MNKKTLNIISVCVVLLIIIFAITNKNKSDIKNSNNIIVDSSGNIKTKADEYQANILETVISENVKNFEKFSNSFKKNSSDNLSDGLSKDIFTQYIKYNTSGEIDKNDILDATQSVLKNKNNIENPVSYSDIKVVTSNVTNLKIYGNDTAIVQNSINKAILGLSPNINKTPYMASIYMKAAEILAQINTPEYLAENHVNLVNGLKKYSEGLMMMEEQLTDPAKALLGLNKVKDATDEVLTSFDKIKKTIILNKIEYSVDAPGYSWTVNNTINTSTN